MIKFLSWLLIGIGLLLIALNSNNILFSAIGSVFLLIKVLPKR